MTCGLDYHLFSGQQCEHEPPFLKSTSTWSGDGSHTLVTSPAWKAQKEIAAKEGLVAIGYEKKIHQFSRYCCIAATSFFTSRIIHLHRVYQAVKLMLYAPASGLYSCPLAMTDGAAKTLLNSDQTLPEVSEAFERLTSRDPQKFWTSGQWMTEQRGGSDVHKGTETIATPIEDKPGWFTLNGKKWFSSATDSDMSLLLARKSLDESLSMFFLRTRDPESNELNGIRIAKLKNKLGTRQLPTAELVLNGAKARLLSEEGRGIAKISSMLGITRLHNIISSVGYQRKMTSLALDYSTRRVAFGKKIAHHPLHLKTLAEMKVEARGNTVLMLDLARQQGLEDYGNIGDVDKLLLRLMMPVAKLYTAKKAVAIASEGIECFGGQGYIEETGIPGMLRDAQVLPIWEGTSNVMALDVLRAMAKTKGEALRAFKNRVSNILQLAGKSNDPAITTALQFVKSALYGLIDFTSQNQSEVSVMEMAGRDFAFSLAHIYVGSLLMEHALATGNDLDAITARQWIISRDMCPVVTNQKANAYRLQREGNHIRELAFEGYSNL